MKALSNTYTHTHTCRTRCEICRDVNRRHTHTHRILNAVNNALCPHKHAQHESQANLFIETGLKQTGGCQLKAKVKGKREIFNCQIKSLFNIHIM